MYIESCLMVCVVQAGGVQKLLPVLEWKEDEYVLAAIRTYDGMCAKSEERVANIIFNIITQDSINMCTMCKVVFQNGNTEILYLCCEK